MNESITKGRVVVHREARAYLARAELTPTERQDVLNFWCGPVEYPSSTNRPFFIPMGLARDFAALVPAGRVLNLCAGIGALAYWVAERHGASCDLACVEQNPEYVAAGRKIVPQAEWVCAYEHQISDLGRFDYVIAKIPLELYSKKGDSIAQRVFEAGRSCADRGLFLLPRNTGFLRHGARWLGALGSVGIDSYADDWQGAPPAYDVVAADFRHPVVSRSALAARVAAALRKNRSTIQK